MIHTRTCPVFYDPSGSPSVVHPIVWDDGRWFAYWEFSEPMTGGMHAIEYDESKIAGGGIEFYKDGVYAGYLFDVEIESDHPGAIAAHVAFINGAHLGHRRMLTVLLELTWLDWFGYKSNAATLARLEILKAKLV